jgi:chromosome partitioning protein
VPAKIIAIVNQKGGVGKTTISMQLAGTLSRRKKRVLVIDADRQGSATRWAANATDEAPFPASVAGLSAANSKIHREVVKFVEDYDFIIIDCPPAVESPVPQSALLIADLALVPILPSPPDLAAAVAMCELINNLQDVNEELKARIVVNGYDPRTILGRETLGVIPEFGVDVCRSYIQDREVYKQSVSFGQTVHYFGAQADAAIREIERLATEVENILQ